MILNPTQRQLLDRVQHDRKVQEAFQQLAQHNLKSALQQLEDFYSGKGKK